VRLCNREVRAGRNRRLAAGCLAMSLIACGPLLVQEVTATASPGFLLQSGALSFDGRNSDATMQLAAAGTTAGDNVVTFRPVADAWVRETSPDRNTGSENRLYVDGRAIDTAFLRFEVSGLSAPVQSAWIELEVIRASPDGGTIRAVSDNSWGEDTIAFDSQPAIDGPALDSSGAVTEGQILRLDVTAAIAQDGQYSFAIVGDGKGGWPVRSREGSDNTPMLFIELEPTS